MKIAFIVVNFPRKNAVFIGDIEYQYEYLKSNNNFPDDIRIFADSYDEDAAPDLPVEPTSAFERWLIEDPEVVVLFHYCDGHSPFNRFLREHCRHVVIRWHIATPPWFTLNGQDRKAHAALLGYETIVDFIDCAHINFWADSRFCQEQLISLGAAPERCHVVLPASSCLDVPPAKTSAAPAPDPTSYTPIKLLFVGRGEAHEGYINAIALADRAQEVLGHRVRLTLIVRAGDGACEIDDASGQSVRSSKAEIVVHRAVPDEALTEFYEAADVFVCLSQHGGFSLPIFEAMRHRLPVVAWATTVFREILVDHPFGFPNYDMDLFVSAIGVLEADSAKSRLLSIQESILNIYSPRLRDKKIRAALASLKSKQGPSVIEDLARPAIKDLPRLVQTIETIRASLYERFPCGFDPELVFDSHDNITSLYDLKIYRDYLDQERELFSLLTAPARTPSITFGPDEFWLGKGVRVASQEGNAPGTLEPTRIAADRLISSQYIRMPPGAYRCELRATITVLSSHQVPLKIDINSQGQQIVGGVLTLSPGVHRDFEPLIVELTGKAPEIEIILTVGEAFDGAVTFSGITFTSVVELEDDMLEREDTPVSGRIMHVIRRWFAVYPELQSRLISASGSKYLLKRQARFFFRKGDAARDDANWIEAAEFYDKGLVLDPTRYGYIIQSAHMHKEAGQFKEAEARYQQALQINSEDDDLLLQIGHFYKRVGKPDLSQSYYQRMLKANGHTVGSSDIDL